MKKTIRFVAITLFMMSASQLMALRYEHQGTGTSIWFPDHWQIKQIGEAFYAISPEGNAVAKYIRLETQNLQQARETYRNYLDPQIQNIRETGKPESFEQHQMLFELIRAEAIEQRSLSRQQFPSPQHPPGMQQSNSAQQLLWKIKIYLITTPIQTGLLVLRHVDGVTGLNIPFNNILESIKPL